MPINGMIFDNRVPTAKAFRNGLQVALADGILSGCDIVFASPYSITIGSGYIVIAGGIFKIDGSVTVNYNFGNYAYTRIIATFDPSQISTETTFEQISFTVDYSDTIDGFSPLTKGDVNGSTSTGTYGIEVAIINNSNSTVYRKHIARANVKYIDGLASGDGTSKHTITIGPGGYAGVTSPDDLPINSTLVSITVLSWSNNATNPGPFSIIPYENGNGKPYIYVMGTPGVKVDNLRLRYWYF